MRLPRIGKISEEGLRGWGKMAEGIFGRRVRVPEEPEEDDLSAQTGEPLPARRQAESTLNNMQMPETGPETGPERMAPKPTGLPPVGPLTMDPEMTEQYQARQDLDAMKLGARPAMPPLSQLQRATREQAVTSGFQPGSSVPYSQWQEWQSAAQKAIDAKELAATKGEMTEGLWRERQESQERQTGMRTAATVEAAQIRAEAAGKMREAMSSERGLDREQRRALFEQGQTLRQQQLEMTARRLEQEGRFEEARDAREYGKIQTQSDDRQFSAFLGSIPAMKLTAEEMAAERTQAKLQTKKTLAGARAKRPPREQRGPPVATARFPAAPEGDQQAKVQKLLELRRRAGR